MSKADDIFWREFGAILLALTVFTIVVFFAARSIGGDSYKAMLNSASAVAERIAPVAKARVGDPSQTVAAAPMPAAAAAPAPPAAAEGEAIYAGACLACHQAGVAGAPKLGDKAAWQARLEQGEDALVQSVINGKGAMPPKAGNPSLTEEQIRVAVKHMVDAVSDSGAGASAGTMVAAATTDAKAADVAKETAEKSTEAVEKAAEKVATTSTESSENADGKPGEEVYNAGCVACHLSGAAGAPKLDDKEAWSTRVSAGLDGLVQSVVKGKGAMPPKGANPSLSEGDIENAVRFMLDKAGVTPGG